MLSLREAYSAHNYSRKLVGNFCGGMLVRLNKYLFFVLMLGCFMRIAAAQPGITAGQYPDRPNCAGQVLPSNPGMVAGRKDGRVSVGCLQGKQDLFVATPELPKRPVALTDYPVDPDILTSNITGPSPGCLPMKFFSRKMACSTPSHRRQPRRDRSDTPAWRMPQISLCRATKSSSRLRALDKYGWPRWLRKIQRQVTNPGVP